MVELPDVTLLKEEYDTYVFESGGIPTKGFSRNQLERVKQALVMHGEWTHEAAGELLYLAEKYGAFILRNAYALALALDIEDGNAEY